jgi:8-oxo-dGTP diphosphatase
MSYIPSGEEEALFLKNYDPSKYKNPAVAADTALFTFDGEGLMILLIKRGGYPYRGYWALPGGFIEIGEDIREAAARELCEETGASGLHLEQVFVWGKPGRDPRQRVITVSYTSITDKFSIKAGDDASDAAWFYIRNYSKNEKERLTYVKYALCGPETLYPEVKFPIGRIQQIEQIKGDRLSFDHAESIAYSLDYIKKRVSEGGFLEYALQCAASVEAAKKAILDL